MANGLVSVKDYGAVGDGVHDDTTAIQQAIDAVWNANQATGGSRAIYVPGGNYRTSLPIFVDPPGAGSLRHNYAAFDPTVTYAPGAVVSYLGIPWVSQLDNNTGNAPELAPVTMFQRYQTGQIIQAQGQYYIALGMFYGFQYTDPTKWQLIPRWWKPFANPGPTLARGAITLLGEDGLGSGQDKFGSIINPVFNDAVMLWTCHGNGNMIRNITVRGPVGSALPGGYNYRAGQPQDGVGIAIPGGGGGASRTLIENCEVDNAYWGIKTGINNGSLGDSNSFRKCNFTNCAYGIAIMASQNFINRVDDCVIGNTKNAIYAPQAQEVTLTGGDLSATSVQASAFAISSTSALTSTKQGNKYLVRFTTVVAAPESFFLAGVYDNFFIRTANYGVVPMTMEHFDPPSGTASMLLDLDWQNFQWHQTDITTATDIGTEIAAAVKMYACEGVTTFYGAGITAIGFHLENPEAPTTLINSVEGFGSSQTNKIVAANYNFNPSYPFVSATPTDAQFAKHCCAQLVPHVVVNNNNLTIEGCEMGLINSPSSRVVVSHTSPYTEFHIRECVNLHANWRFTNGSVNPDPYAGISGGGVGGGELDWPYFGVVFAPYAMQGESVRQTMGRSPQWGFRPAAYTRPMLNTTQLAALQKSPLPAILPMGSGGNTTYQVGYPLLWGGQPYSVEYFDNATLPVAPRQLSSLHRCFTYGQSLTPQNVPNLAWSTKGSSSVIACNPELFGLLFCGLLVNLGGRHGVVTAIHAGLGYFTVIWIDPPNNAAAAIVTGTTIGQEPFNLVLS